MILIFSKFAMNFYKNHQNAAILKIMLILKNCYGRFTANHPKFLSSHSIHRKIIYNFTMLVSSAYIVTLVLCKANGKSLI